MKKFLLATVAMLLVSAGSAHADKGYWFGCGSCGSTATTWNTYVWVNNDSGGSVATTVTFYRWDGTALGSTTKTIVSNGGWFFNLGNLGNVASTVFNGTTGGDDTTDTNNRRGWVDIKPTTVRGFTTLFESTYSGGFNFSHGESTN